MSDKVRGRASIADEIVEGLEDFEDSEGSFLVMYAFARPKGKSITPAFWRNLNRLFDKLGDGKRIKLSVIECKMLRTAMAIKELAEHYKARDVSVYRFERLYRRTVEEPQEKREVSDLKGAEGG